MISSETFKREGIIIVVCISLSFIFRLGVSLISEYYESLIKQVEIDLAEKARFVGVKPTDEIGKKVDAAFEKMYLSKGIPQAEKKYKIMGKDRYREAIEAEKLLGGNHNDYFPVDSVPQAENEESNQELQALEIKMRGYNKNIWSREEKDRAQNRLFWGLLLFVYSGRGIKAFVASGISLEKKMFVFLSIWSFAHVFTYIVTEGDGSYEEFFPFYSFWDTPLGEVYDFTELFFYVGGGWLFFFLYKYLKKDSIN